MIRALICLFSGHKPEKYGKETVVQPHDSVAYMGPAIFQEMVCTRCGARWTTWVRHPYDEAKKR